ncbi:MAG: hypothetical protein M1833_006126 [Piccolia ochrophora]|nr:MAG: hypothetical protein M1833_006126 [Piccolia ochrophora]
MLVQELSKPPEQRVEWLFFFDADTIILNPNIPLSAFLPPDVAPDAASKSEFNSSSIHFLPNADGGGINIGTFFLRVHPWSLAFLLRVLELPHVRPELKIEESWNTEQNAYKHAAAEADHREHIRYIPRHWINAYEVNRADSEESIFDGLTGDLLVHFPGLRADTRRAHMDAWFEELENHPAKWRVPFKETTIEAETKAYWYSLAVAEHVLQRLSKTLDTKLIAGGSDRETVGRLDTAMKELQSVIWGKANDWNAITKLTEDVQAYTE